MSAILADCGPILKNQRNNQQGFMFRGIDQVYTALNPLFARNKVFIMSEVLEHKYEIKTTIKGTSGYQHFLKVRFEFISGEDGSSVCAHAIGEAWDSGDKGINKCMSVALKYAAFQAFMIPTEAIEDPDKETVELNHEAKEKPKGKPPAKPAGTDEVTRWQDWKIPFKSSDNFGKTLSELAVEAPEKIQELFDWCTTHWDVHTGPKAAKYRKAIGFMREALQSMKNLDEKAKKTEIDGEPVEPKKEPAKKEPAKKEPAKSQTEQRQSEAKKHKDTLKDIENLDEDDIPF